MRGTKYDLTSQTFKRNPSPTWQRMREDGSLVKGRIPLLGNTWMATDYDTVNEVLRNHKRFVNESHRVGRRKAAGIKWWMPSMVRVLSQHMLLKDEPAHRRLRGLVEQAFLRHNVESIRNRIEELTIELLAPLQEGSRQGQGSVDLIKSFAQPLPLIVICELLGLPTQDRHRFIEWASRLSGKLSTWGMIRAFGGVRHLYRYLRTACQTAARSPNEGLLKTLAEVEQEGDRLTEDEMVAMAFLLLLAGHETTTHLISGGILCLLQHPTQQKQFLESPERRVAAVHEILRYYSPVQMTKIRYALEDTVLGDQTVSRGDPITAILASANNDPLVFHAPDEFDIGRTPNRHVGFGAGIHVCLGLKLALCEAEVALTRLFECAPNLELAIPDSELTWTPRLGLRALVRLPVHLTA